MSEHKTSFSRFELALTRGLEGTLAFLLLAIFATVVLLVVLRYLFGSTIIGANEVIVILFVYSTAIGAALAIGKNEHLAIVFATERLSSNWQKFLHRLRVLLVAAINLVAIIYSAKWMHVTGDFLMPSTGLPRWVAQLSIPLGCSIALVYCFFNWRHAPAPRQKESAPAIPMPRE